MDLTILNFSKAFDTVSHIKLLHKLWQYSVGGNISTWMALFLTGCDQYMVVDGRFSDWVHVDSRLPHRTVLGPLVFLLHVNDFADSVSHPVRLLANDGLILTHQQIYSVDGHTELDSLHEWVDHSTQLNVVL